MRRGTEKARGWEAGVWGGPGWIFGGGICWRETADDGEGVFEGLGALRIK